MDDDSLLLYTGFILATALGKKRKKNQSKEKRMDKGVVGKWSKERGVQEYTKGVKIN